MADDYEYNELDLLDDTGGVLQEFEDYDTETEEVEDALAEYDEDQIKQFEAMREKIAQSRTVESDDIKSRMRSLDSVGKDVDSELERLLSKDAIAEKDFENRDDFLVDFINDPTVYDTIDRSALDQEGDGADGTPFFLKNKLAAAIIAKLSFLPNIVLYALIGVMSLTFITLIVIMILVVLQSKAQTVNDPAIKISSAPVAVNSANYIYINSQSSINGKALVLVKMIYDRLATVFYFNKEIDVQQYNISLTDNFGNAYAMDLSFYPFSETLEDGRTVMRFEPFVPNVESFVLSITDPLTDSRAEYEFVIEGTALPPAKYTYPQESFLTAFPGITAKIESAMFSSSGSIVNFSFSWENSGEGIAFGSSPGAKPDDPAGVPIVMYQSATVLPKKEEPNMYSFEEYNTIIGRMDFGPVRNLTGNVYVTFQNLLKQYPINKDVSVSDIWLKRADSNAVLDMGDYELHIDRMVYQAGKYILVIHAVDNSMFARSGEEYDTDDFSRAEVMLDATLVAVTPQGAEIRLSGKTYTRQAGSDILYDPADMAERLKGADPNKFRLEIKSASVRIGDVTTVINLDKSALKPDDKASDIEREIVSRFENRLAYKSGEDTKITGFAGGAANAALYTPSDYTGKAEYSAQVVSHKIMGNNDVIAVVYETWRDERNGESVFFSAAHSVVCKYDGENMTVISDEIHK